MILTSRPILLVVWQYCSFRATQLTPVYQDRTVVTFLHVVNIFKELRQASFSVQSLTHFRPLSVPDTCPGCMQCWIFWTSVNFERSKWRTACSRTSSEMPKAVYRDAVPSTVTRRLGEIDTETDCTSWEWCAAKNRNGSTEICRILFVHNAFLGVSGMAWTLQHHRPVIGWYYCHLYREWGNSHLDGENGVTVT